METSKHNSKMNKRTENNFFDDYLEIMKNSSSGDFISTTEWKSEGDYFKKLSMYDEYTPVETSSNTTSL